MRVFITGGTGQVGSRLIPLLLERGDTPVVLTRRYQQARQLLGPNTELVEGDPTKAGSWTESLANCDAVIHLAGENLFAKRWNAQFKQQLIDSRVQSTQRLTEALIQQANNPNNPRPGAGKKVFVCASAIGYYGPHADEELDETAAVGSDYLAKLCEQWESASQPLESAGIRRAILRVGVVLDKSGGALAKLLPPFKMGVGGPVGSGKQWMSWIHHADLTGLLLFLLDQSFATGVINGTAPYPVTNKEFSRTLGKTLGRPALFWTPGFMLRLMLGEVSEVVTNSQRVVPRRALELGYNFRYPTLESALTEIFAR